MGDAGLLHYLKDSLALLAEFVEEWLDAFGATRWIPKFYLISFHP